MVPSRSWLEFAVARSQASSAQDSMAAVSAEGSTVCVLSRALLQWLSGRRAKANGRSPARGADLADLRAKKSRSTVSCAIFACSRSISRSGSDAPSAGAALERSRRLLLKLLLPSINLVRVNLVAQGRIGHRRLSSQRLQGGLRLIQQL